MHYKNNYTASHVKPHTNPGITDNSINICEDSRHVINMICSVHNEVIRADQALVLGSFLTQTPRKAETL